METLVEVTQADRDAAADFMSECAPYLGDCGMKNSVELALRQTLARHRLNAERLSSPTEEMRQVFDADGKMLPEMHGREITLRATIGYPGSRISDLIVGDIVWQVSNDVIRAALERSHTTKEG